MIFYFSYKKLVFSWKSYLKWFHVPLHPLNALVVPHGWPWNVSESQWKVSETSFECFVSLKVSWKLLKDTAATCSHSFTDRQWASSKIIQQYWVWKRIVSFNDFAKNCVDRCHEQSHPGNPLLPDSRIQSREPHFHFHFFATSISGVSGYPGGAPYCSARPGHGRQVWELQESISPNHFSTCLMNSLFLLKMFLIPG